MACVAIVDGGGWWWWTTRKSTRSLLAARKIRWPDLCSANPVTSRSGSPKLDELGFFNNRDFRRLITSQLVLFPRVTSESMGSLVVDATLQPPMQPRGGFGNSRVSALCRQASESRAAAASLIRTTTSLPYPRRSFNTRVARRRPVDHGQLTYRAV